MTARVVLGVGAGIAAYKACELLRLLTESGHQVRVVPTPDALRFVGEPTWAALSGQPVTVTPWENVHEVPHVRLGQEADLVFVAPATADLLARAAAGLFRVANRVLARGTAGLAADLAGRQVVVSAGGTREELDPVRFLGNWSSGRQGYELAATAAARGAKVTLVAANTALADPAGARVLRVVSAAELREAMLDVAPSADAVVMAAAVADYRPAARAGFKLKKTGGAPEPIELAENPDILRELAGPARRPGQVIVGFAAETGDLLANGQAKLAAKGCDLLVVNQVGGGLAFGTSDNAAVILAADGGRIDVPRGPKEVLADFIWDAVAARLPG